ncbi:hypothetical protein Ahy_A04g017928 isoform A [Arachis hypogaea]|uniref:SWIM-type domain-containing protein n=1 Tax=Arachis hypogaea TaxID=3818 RepID=A0A445DCI4_ARAHY|nr:hypothetical protein Ahy_A04g017928 isoform A [Arachis hypogaea]
MPRSSSDSYESAKDSLYKSYIPLECVESSSDNDDVAIRGKERLIMTMIKKATGDEDVLHPPSMDASTYKKEVDDDEEEENLQYAAEVMFEVHDQPHNVVVDLGNQTCSCRSWQLSGLPCRPEIAAISVMNCRSENYVYAWLTMESYNKPYEHHINPVRDQKLSKPRERPSHYARKKMHMRHLFGGAKNALQQN